MQKRLSSHEITLYVILGILALLILLLMYQVDRQWNKLAEMQRTVSEQTGDVREVRSSINSVKQQLASGSLVSSDAISAAVTSGIAAAGGVAVMQSTSTGQGTASQDAASGDKAAATTAKAGESKSSTNTSSAGGESAAQASTADSAKKSEGAFARAKRVTQQPDFAQGDWKVASFQSTVKTISPLVSSDAYASDVQENVLESLLTRNPETLDWEGLIAKSWQISEDGLTITFQMREDVQFSDGKPLTADDVVFSFDFIMNEAIKAPGERAFYSKIGSVNAKGPYEAEFVFKEPYFQALGAAGGLAILPKHFYEKYMAEDKAKEFNESKGLLLGSGPYRLADPTSWTSDKGTVELLRNPRYWGEVQPTFDRLVWKIIQNDSARLTTYRNGDIDIYSARPIEYQKLQKDEQIIGKSQNFEYMSPVQGYSYIGWNQKDDKDGNKSRFADKRVRQAMTYLTDRDQIIKDIYLGHAEPAISPFSPRSKQHDKSLLPRKADVAKAKALLKEAGYEDRDKDGLLEDADGKPLSFKLMYSQGSDDTKRLVLLMKDMYAKAGVQMLPDPTEWSVMLERLDNKEFDATILGWSSGLETDVYQMFHSDQIKDNGNNFISYHSEELDKTIEAARVVVDDDKRMPIWQKAERIFYEDQPYTFLMRRKSLVFIDKRIRGLELTNVGLNLSLQPYEIYVPGAEQKYR